MAIDKTGLLTYVDNNVNELITKAKVGAPSVKYFNKMLNVKGATTLNLMEINGKLKPLGCEATDSATTKLSQRTIDAKPLELSTDWCIKDFVGTFAQHNLMMEAGLEELPFGEKLANALVDAAVEDVEKTIWQGDTTTGNYMAFDGIIKLAEAATLASTVTYATDETITSIVNKIRNAMPEAVYSAGHTPCIFMGADAYDKYMQELVANGNIVMNVAGWDKISAPEYVIAPASRGIRVYGVPGLSNTGKFFGSYAENFFYGTDLEDALSTVTIEEKNHRKYVGTIITVAGVQIAFPDLVVEAKQA